MKLRAQLLVFGAVLVTTFVAGAQTIGTKPNWVQPEVTKNLTGSLAPLVSEQLKKIDALLSEKRRAESMSSKNLAPKVEGGVSTGGGDADVIEFLNIANALDLFLQNAPQYCPGSDCAFFSAYVVKLNQNLGSNEKSLVSFTQKVLVDFYGTEKQALFNREDLSILVNRSEWHSLQNNTQAKFALVAAEIFGLGGANERYFRVGEISKNIVALDSRQNASGKYSESIEGLDKAVIACVESVQHQLNSEMSQLEQEYEGKINKADIEAFRYDSVIVARMRARACMMSAL